VGASWLNLKSINSICASLATSETVCDFPIPGGPQIITDWWRFFQQEWTGNFEVFVDSWFGRISPPALSQKLQQSMRSSQGLNQQIKRLFAKAANMRTENNLRSPKTDFKIEC
jgi:hypothetical protein